MWPPPNIQSLPSKEEIQSVKEEISTIELEIVERELSLNALRKSLSERKAWIAPIRTTPLEILSLIFIDVSRADWKAPLVLQSVSRQWRHVVVDSPKAWTFIPLSKYSSKRRSELISLFLERSRNKPLHISVGDDSLLGYMAHLAGRIECFHLKMARVLLNFYLQCGHTFHRLERLKMSHWGPAGFGESLLTDDLVAWDMLLFPNLKVLDISFVSLSLFRAISAAPEFPAIRHLTVKCMEPWRLPDFLTKCAASLESVDLIYINKQPEGLDAKHTIHFPRLRYLRLVDLSNEAGPRFRFKASTPNLQVYLDDGDISTLNAVKVDTGSVVFLQIFSTPDLSRYPRLETLCFTETGQQDEEVINAIESLRDNPVLCPGLALIEYATEVNQEQLAKAKDALMARGDVTGHVIQLKEGTSDVWNERMQALRVVEMCGRHMPCRVLT